jgi:hypothetical protein
MRTMTKLMLAFGLAAGAATLSLPGLSSAKAQGFYVDAPGIHIGTGYRHHHRYYRRYRDYGYRDYGYRDGYGAYGYAPDRAYIGRSGYPQCTRPGFTWQDGACKPYRGY